MPEPDDRPTYQFSDLNLLGKAVFMTGAVVRSAATLVDRAVERAAEVYVEAEDAFRRELDASFEDAKILEERSRHEDPSRD
jgi:hypothetical protein